MEMTVAVQRTVHAELGISGGRVFFHLLDKLRCKGFELGIDGGSRGQAKLDGCPRLERLADHPE
jgi:hypothetical protein